MSTYAASIPVFVQMLNSLSAVLDKAEAHAAAKKIAPEVFPTSRLYPDMLPLTRQVQVACDFASKTTARLTQAEIPTTPDTETTIADLKARIAKAVAYVKGFKPEQFGGADTREVNFPVGPSATMTLKGEQYLHNYALPNFYFHVVTAYDILRHNGVEIGKRDFLGAA
ncbi:MAG: hypothetical protein A4S14_19060 [Proteobacteria bacterium SG_bin9]|nr:MAG: hypothetical protein A4S14_19060 [Proteobacteria bacterium SG_bin9]